MTKKILLIILFISLVVAVFFKSPISANYNLAKGKEYLNAKKYQMAVKSFEKSLFAQPNNKETRYNYAIALSKVPLTYSVQKKMYSLANSTIEDKAKLYAQTSISQMKKELLRGYEYNYIEHAISGDDVIRWNIKSFPLNVYIENSNSVPPYYLTSIRKAMSVWEKRTNFVKFREINNPQDAQILISFNDIPKDVCSGFVCHYAIATTEPKISGKTLRKMYMNIYKTTHDNKNFTSREITNTAMHELGHALGILGHSDKAGDLMYSAKETDTSYRSMWSTVDQDMTLRDLRTLVVLYRIAPTITDVKSNISEKMYYGPLILGSREERILGKVKEYSDYIAKYPTAPMGYINLAYVYADVGMYKEALAELSKAERYAKSKNDSFIIYYNKAMVSYELKNKEDALKYANLAKSIRDDSDLEELISEIEKLR